MRAVLFEPSTRRVLLALQGFLSEAGPIKRNGSEAFFEVLSASSPQKIIFKSVRLPPKKVPRGPHCGPLK
jgi:hypothetical protein